VYSHGTAGRALGDVSTFCMADPRRAPRRNRCGANGL